MSSAKEAKHVIASLIALKEKNKSVLVIQLYVLYSMSNLHKYKGVERHYFVEIPPLERGNQSRLVELFLGLF